MSDIMATPPAPVNYSGLQIQADPVGNFLKAGNLQAQTGLMNAQAAQAGAVANMQTYQLARQQQYLPMLQQVLQNPTPSNFSALTAMFPDQHAAITSSYDMSQLAQRQAVIQPVARAYSALLNNRPDLALNEVQQQRDALTNSNTDPNDPAYQQKLQHFDMLAQTIKTDPKAATGLMGATLSSVLPPDQFAQMFGKFMTTPADVGKANADATTAQAKADVAPQQARADLAQTNATVSNINSEVANRAAQFNLSQQEFQTKTQLELRKLNYEQNVPNMRGNTAEIVNQTVQDSVQHGMQADRIGSALSNIEMMKQNNQWTDGALADLRAKGQSVFGTQDDWNSLRTEYNALRNSSIFGTIQNGRTTDSDLKVLNQGFPAPNAQAAQIETFLNSMRNVELRQARVDEGKSAWGSAFGYMGPATHDTSVAGQQVSKGTSFADFNKGRIATLSTAPSAFDAPTAAPGVQVGNGAPPLGAAAPGPLTGAASRYNKYVTQ